MSGLITRIRNSLCNSVKRFACTLTKKQIGIAAITTATACMGVKNLATQDNKNNTEKKKDLELKDIYNLKEMVEKEMYKKEPERGFFERKRELKLDWDDVKFLPGEVDYVQIVKLGVKDKFQVLFKTSYTNDSWGSHEHRLKTKRQTHYRCEGFLIAGYSIGSGMELRFPTPSQLANTGSWYSTGFMIKNPQGDSEEKKDTWEIEDRITIPKRSKIDIAVQTTEKKTEFDFTTRVGFTGKVKGRFLNKKQKVLGTIIIPIGEIINTIPSNMTTREDNIDYINIQGRVSYTHDVQHDIIIK